MVGSLIVLAVVIASGLALRHAQVRPRPLADWVAELGIPTFLAKRAEFRDDPLPRLEAWIVETDPQTVTNWNGLSEVIVLWHRDAVRHQEARGIYSSDLVNSNSMLRSFGWQPIYSVGIRRVLAAKVGEPGQPCEVTTMKVGVVDVKLGRRLPPPWSPSAVLLKSETR